MSPSDDPVDSPDDHDQEREQERQQLQATIAALHGQRAVLGDAVVDTAIAPMRERLAALAASASQVLRQVSVLFMDVVGAATLGRHLDPEDMHEVMDGVMVRGTATVLAHGGRVLQYAGDSLLAAFGTEQVREDDAERAVHCALALLADGEPLRQRVLQQHGVDGCGLRVGVHSGPVLLGGGVDEAGTIRGLTVNIAARMEQTAPDGALRISHDTFELVRGVFDVQAQPPLQVKGRDEPMLTYLVQRAKPRAFRLPARGIDGLHLPMVGRDAELATLTTLLDEVAAQRRQRAVTLLADAGLGKSRLLQALQGALEAHPQRFVLLLGRAHPDGRLQPYGLLRDLLAWRLQIADSDGRDQARATLVDGLQRWLGADAVAQAHLIGQLIGLDFSDSPHLQGLEPRLRRTLAFDALRDLLRAMAADGAVPALLLEDLQWADDGSLDFLSSHVLADDSLPLLLLATARPELLEHRPTWGEGAAAHQRLGLGALDGAQAQALADALLRRVADGAPALQALLLERAAGNPFFMEELVRMFIDHGVVEVGGGGPGEAAGEAWQVHLDRLHDATVPATLVGVLQARLDALPAAQRQALQQASIVGPVFWDDALRELDDQAPAALGALRARGLLQQREGSAFAGSAEYAFHHQLLQQVAYDTVLKPARRAGHAVAARWLAQRVAQRPAETLAITAEHFERAGDAAQALAYFHRAAQDAQARFANEAAQAHVERALASPAATDLRLRDQLCVILQNLADLLGRRQQQEAVLAQRAAIAEQLDDDGLRASVLVAQALLASRRNDETQALQLATRAMPLAERAGQRGTAALARAQAAWSLHTRGEHLQALALTQQALTLVRAALADEATPALLQQEVQVCTLRANIEMALGQLAQAGRTLADGLALAEARGLRRPRVSLLQSLGLLAMRVGQHAQALPYLESSGQAARDIGWLSYEVSAWQALAEALMELGQWARAAEVLDQAEDGAVRCEFHDVQGRCQMLRARLRAQAGAVDEALAELDRAEALFTRIDSAAMVCLVRGERAEVLLAQGRLAEALALADLVLADLDAGLSLSVTEDPLRPWLACHRVLAAAGHPRATPLIDQAHAQLQALARSCGSEEERASLLQGLAVHRAVAEAWAAAH